MGDHRQLGAVGPGGGLESLVARYGAAVDLLTDNVRQRHVAVAQLLHRRKPLLALTGAALVLVGILSSDVYNGVQLLQHQMIHPAADREQMVGLLERLGGGIGPRVILVGMLVGLFLVSRPSARFDNAAR